MQDLTQSPFELKWKHIYLPSAAKGVWRFSERAATVMSPSLSMIRRCGLILCLNIALRPPPLPLGLAPNPFLSDFRRPYFFCASRSTHTGVGVIHSPISTFIWVAPNSSRPLTPRPWWRLCYRSVRTPAHIYGSDPISPPQKEDPLRRPFCIAAQSGQCDAATTP